MGGKQMEGDNRERRGAAQAAREQGRQAGDVGATTGGTQQRTKAKANASHQKKIDLQREGKQETLTENTPAARPGSRDPATPDRERRPRLDR